MQQYLPRAKQTIERIAGKNTHVWQYVKSASSATSALLNHIESIIREEKFVVSVQEVEEGCKEKSMDSVRLSKAEVAEVAVSSDGRTCGGCACWHKPSCSFPGANFDCVAPTNPFAADCRDYVEKEREKA